MAPIRVSDMLAMAGCVDPWWFTSDGRERGTTVHFVGEQIMLARDCVFAPDYAGYAQAISDGLRALGFRPLLVERRLVHSSGLFSGRPDGVGLVPVPAGKVPAGPALVDIKSGKPLPSHALQLGFYDILADDCAELQAMLPAEWRGYPWTRVGLYVQENGDHSIETYTDYADRAVCQGIIDTQAWRQRHGLITSSGRGSGDSGGHGQPDDDPFADAGPGVPAGGADARCGF